MPTLSQTGCHDGEKNLSPSSVIPTGAEPLDFARRRLRDAQWKDLFCCLGGKRRSLDWAAPWAASVGLTE
jgi:hypothetical protein